MTKTLALTRTSFPRPSAGTMSGYVRGHYFQAWDAGLISPAHAGRYTLAIAHRSGVVIFNHPPTVRDLLNVLDIHHSHTVATLNLLPGDYDVSGPTPRIVTGIERNPDNLGATLVRFADGTVRHSSTYDAWMIYRP